MQESISETSFLRFIIAYIIIFLSYNCIHAQSDIIQIKRDYVISAEASNLFPKINEPVNIAVKLKSPIDAKQGEFGLFFTWADGTAFVSGTENYSGDLRKGQIITIQVSLKFPVKKAYFVNLNLNTTNKRRLVDFKFYVDGGFVESQEVSELRNAIAKLKEILIKSKPTNDASLKYYAGPTFSNAVSGKHTIIATNEYEKKDLESLQQKNTVLYNKLKKEFDSLYIENNKLLLQRERSEKEPFKKHSSKDNIKAGWYNK